MPAFVGCETCAVAVTPRFGEHGLLMPPGWFLCWYDGVLSACCSQTCADAYEERLGRELWATLEPLRVVG